MKREFDIQISVKDLFRFNLRQAYTSTQGPVSIIIAILFIVCGSIALRDGNYQYTALYYVVAVLFVVYMPVTLYNRSKRALKKNAVLAGVLHYAFTEDAIVVTSGDESGELPWGSIYKMIATKNYLLIYSNRINAYIIPREQLGDGYLAVKELATSKLEKYRIKMK